MKVLEHDLYHAEDAVKQFLFDANELEDVPMNVYALIASIQKLLQVAIHLVQESIIEEE